MRLLHAIVGVSAVFIFLLTGQYLEFYYPEMEGVDDGTRMMFRWGHLYILLAGLSTSASALTSVIGKSVGVRRCKWPGRRSPSWRLCC